MGRPQYQAEDLAAEIADLGIHRFPRRYNDPAIESAGPISHFDGQMRDRHFILESPTRHDAIGHVVDEHKLHRLARVGRPRRYLDLFALSRRPTEVCRTQYWKQVWIPTRRAPFLFLNPFGPPQPLVARAISEYGQLQVGPAHARPEVEMRRNGRPAALAIVCDGRRSALE